MTKPDEELRKSFTISVDNASGLMNIAFFVAEYDDDNNARQAELFKEEALKLLAENSDQSYNCVVDITLMGKLGYVSKKAGEVYRELAGHKQIGKVAIIGNTDFQNAILEFAFFLMKTFSRKVSWFSSKEEALIWLGNK